MARCRPECYRVASVPPVRWSELERRRRGLQWVQWRVVGDVVCDGASARGEVAGPVEECQERGRGQV
jgi:hypothetical protein